MSSTWTDACPLEDIPVGQPTAVRIGTMGLVAVRTEDRVHFCESLCPHKFAELAEGTIEDGCLRCPQHDAAFHLVDGSPREGDEWAGTLKTYDARVVDGMVQVQLTASD